MLARIFTHAHSRFHSLVDPKRFIHFRIFFGLCLLLQSFWIFDAEFVRTEIAAAELHFHFGLFDWLHLPEVSVEGAWILIWIMRIASLGIVLGFLFRFWVALFGLSFLYFFLLEKSFYNNHYYLILLLCFWLLVCGSYKRPIPYWNYLVLRFCMVLVYLFGAVTKLNSDWMLRAEPMGTWLMDSVFGHVLDRPELAYFLSWSGMGLDLWAAWKLSQNRVTKGLVTALIAFHSLNHVLFHEDIGVFPLVMLSALVLFHKPRVQKPTLFQDDAKKKMMTAFLLVFGVVQLVLPLRHWLIPGNVMWTYEGNRFSWRMKDHHKYVRGQFWIRDGVDGEKYFYPFYSDLTPKQSVMVIVPEMIVQYALWLEKNLKNDGWQDPQVFFRSVASMNGRPFQPWINPNHDLTTPTSEVELTTANKFDK